MKTIIYFTTLLLTLASITFSQSVIDCQSGASIVVQPGANISADNIIVNGKDYDAGSISSTPMNVLNLIVLIEGLYNSLANTMVSDTISVYLRSASFPYPIVDSSIAVIDSITFAGNFIFANAIPGIYYIQLKHRNSIETWSKSGGETYTAGSAFRYDFTSHASQAYGSNVIQKGTKYCIYSGDVNQDGVIDGADAVLIDNDAFNFIMGYIVTDLTGDDVVDASDAAIADNNASNFVSVIRP